MTSNWSQTEDAMRSIGKVKTGLRNLKCFGKGKSSSRRTNSQMISQPLAAVGERASKFETN